MLVSPLNLSAVFYKRNKNSNSENNSTKLEPNNNELMSKQASQALKNQINFASRCDIEHYDQPEIYLYRNAEPYKVRALLEETSNGHIQFVGKTLDAIVQYIKENPKDIDLLNIILNVRERDGKPRVNGNMSLKILQADNAQYADRLDYLLNFKDDNNNFRLTPNEAAGIYQSINETNKDSLDLLLNAKSTKGNYRFNGCDVKRIFRCIDEQNVNYLSELLEAKVAGSEASLKPKEIADAMMGKSAKSA